MYLYSERIYTPKGYKKGYIEVEDGKIKEIHENIEGEYMDYGDKVIVPGFIDIHIHGWATGSFIHEATEESLEKMSKELVKVGVTSYLPSTGADALDTIKGQLSEGK